MTAPIVAYNWRRDEILAPVSRWTPERKRALVHAVLTGIVSTQEAKAAHHLSAEELDAWRRGFTEGRFKRRARRRV